MQSELGLFFPDHVPYLCNQIILFKFLYGEQKRRLFLVFLSVLCKKEKPITTPVGNCTKDRLIILGSLKVHKRENFLGFDFEICTFS